MNSSDLPTHNINVVARFNNLHPGLV